MLHSSTVWKHAVKARNDPNLPIRSKDSRQVSDRSTTVGQSSAADNPQCCVNALFYRQIADFKGAYIYIL